MDLQNLSQIGNLCCIRVVREFYKVFVQMLCSRQMFNIHTVNHAKVCGTGSGEV